mmetsp:Transcript_3959/g.4565  ORF Transcript_3959/g.4565 Transcript_3959/m.4565 type:complete len:151 (-) Transcript_3959:477-929(-)
MMNKLKPTSFRNSFLKIRRDASSRKIDGSNNKSHQKLQKRKNLLRRRFSFRKNRKTHTLQQCLSEASVESLKSVPLETPEGDVTENPDQEDEIERGGEAEKRYRVETKLSAIQEQYSDEKEGCSNEKKVREENSEKGYLGFTDWLICGCI